MKFNKYFYLELQTVVQQNCTTVYDSKSILINKIYLVIYFIHLECSEGSHQIDTSSGVYYCCEFPA